MIYCYDMCKPIVQSLNLVIRSLFSVESKLVYVPRGWKEGGRYQYKLDIEGVVCVWDTLVSPNYVCGCKIGDKVFCTFWRVLC